MPEPRDIGLLPPRDRSQWVRLRTLTGLRWVAIAGQLVALNVAQFAVGLTLQVGFSFMVVGVAIIANLLALFLYPENKRLSENEAMLWLLFDVAQLGALLLLTGGLNNPFALLLLTPVTISATALRPRSTLILGAVALVYSLTPRYTATSVVMMDQSEEQIIDVESVVSGFSPDYYSIVAEREVLRSRALLGRCAPDPLAIDDS